MKYWIQTRAPAGNWVDSIGTDSRESALESCISMAMDRGHENVRVISRVDTVIYP